MTYDDRLLAAGKAPGVGDQRRHRDTITLVNEFRQRDPGLAAHDPGADTAGRPEGERLKFTNKVTIARPARDVFAYLAQLEKVPEWNYAISRTWKVSEGPVGKGAKYRQQRTIPNRVEEAFEVVEFLPDEKLAISGRLGPFAAHLTYLLAEDGAATVLTNDVELEPSGLLRLVAPLAASRVKDAVAANLNVLKQILES